MTSPVLKLPADWKTWPAEKKARLRWRLLTDLNPEHPRPNQLTPGAHALCPRPDCDGSETTGHVPWDVWLLLAGRGFGKTRCGAEDVAHYAMYQLNTRIALVAETFSDGRDTMVEGESGLLSVLPTQALRGGDREAAWNRSIGELFLKNGSQFKIYSSEKPDKLRGPQHHRAWVDEPAKFKDAYRGDAEDTTWNNLMLGMRLGDDPKVVVTGTPKNVKLVKQIIADPHTVVTRGSTYDNVHNLAPQFKRRILAKYEGTRLGRQELNAELMEDVEGALWTHAQIDQDRVAASAVPSLVRVVVGVDPQAVAGEDTNDTGIIGCGVGEDGHGYVLRDVSLNGTPAQWGKRVCDLYHEVTADRIVAEANNGGDMVIFVISTVDETVNARKVHASRGKHTRAEPISALYEQHRVHHVEGLPDLEDEMCSWVPGEDSPDRMDALVWALTELMLGDQPFTEPGDLGAMLDQELQQANEWAI